ncbi:Transcription factor CPC [Capsicum annuum]|nr:Transcription factor CPC [Capsicum annuum]KAF3682932.1 Transcription factor CPC [Capsicum annuum]
MADMDRSSTSNNNPSMDSSGGHGFKPWKQPLAEMQAFEANNEETSKLEFSEDEEFLVTKMFNLVGERWSLIAGRIPGRTAEEIEKYWNSRNSTSQ